MQQPLRILIPMMEAGAGHKMTALAVRDALVDRYGKDVLVEVTDLARHAGAAADDGFLKGAWDIMLKHPIVAWVGWYVLKTLRLFASTYLPLVHRGYWRAGRAYIEAFGPDIVFSTHFFATQIASRAARGMPARGPAPSAGRFTVMQLVTDPFVPHPWWAMRGADLVITASERASALLRRYGIPAARVMRLPFVIHEKYRPAAPEAVDAGRIRLGLRPDRLTILVVEGGQGIGRTWDYARLLCREGRDVNLILVCGRNEALRSEFESLAASSGSAGRVACFGFVDGLQDLLPLVDVVVTKAGPSTIFEALACGVPLIFSRYASIHEKPNMEYCIERGVGWYCPQPQGFLEQIDRLSDAGFRAEVRRRVDSLSYRSGAAEAAELIMRTLRNKKDDACV